MEIGIASNKYPILEVDEVNFFILPGQWSLLTVILQGGTNGCLVMDLVPKTNGWGLWYEDEWFKWFMGESLDSTFLISKSYLFAITIGIRGSM